MDQKGQASSVFQLLIAAIVAVVILTILMGVLGVIPGLGGGDPTEESKNLMKQAAVNLGTPSTKEITFTPNKAVINSATISRISEVGIPSGNICMSTGYGGQVFTALFQGNPEGAFDSAISYNGTSNQKIKLLVICDDGVEILKDVGLAASAPRFTKIKSDWFESCDIPPGRESETYCFIALSS